MQIVLLDDGVTEVLPVVRARLHYNNRTQDRWVNALDLHGDSPAFEFSKYTKWMQGGNGTLDCDAIVRVRFDHHRDHFVYDVLAIRLNGTDIFVENEFSADTIN